MPRLGELLVASGLLTADQIEQALRAQVMWGGRLGTNLIELGLIDLDTLSRALGRQHRMPAALAKHFDKGDPAIQQLLSPDFAERFSCVPLFRAGPEKRVIIASLAPLDKKPTAIIADELGVDPTLLVPSIAAELRIRYHLERVYNIPRGTRFLRSPGKTNPQFPAFVIAPVAPDSDPEIRLPTDSVLEPAEAVEAMLADEPKPAPRERPPVAAPVTAPVTAPVRPIAAPIAAPARPIAAPLPAPVIPPVAAAVSAAAPIADSPAARAPLRMPPLPRLPPMVVPAVPRLPLPVRAPPPPPALALDLEPEEPEAPEDPEAPEEPDAARAGAAERDAADDGNDIFELTAIGDGVPGDTCAPLAPIIEPPTHERRRYVRTLADEPAPDTDAAAQLARIAIRRVKMPTSPPVTGTTLGEATRAIRRGLDRDKVADLVVGSVDRFMPEVESGMLLVVRGEVAISWKGFARNGDPLPEIAIPMDQPGLVPSATERNLTVRATSSDLGPIDELLLGVLGGHRGDLVVVPVSISGQVMCVIAMVTPRGAEVASVESIAAAMGAAFARLMRDASR